MTARDRFQETIRCDTCGTGGVARLSQEDGWAFKNDQSTRVDFIPDGFDYVGGSGFNDPVKFYCKTCGLKGAGL